jgi:hypothetical protein
MSVIALVLVGAVAAGGRSADLAHHTGSSATGTRSASLASGSLRAVLTTAVSRFEHQQFTLLAGNGPAIRVHPNLTGRLVPFGAHPFGSSACFVASSGGICRLHACTAEFIGAGSQAVVPTAGPAILSAIASRPQTTACPRPQPMVAVVVQVRPRAVRLPSLQSLARQFSPSPAARFPGSPRP